jgi:FG-GAP-like repeat
MMPSSRNLLPVVIAVSCIFAGFRVGRADEPGLKRIQYNNPGLVVDLGVGLWAWPLPMDYDRDGDLDLVVSCPDKPYRGTYFFENPGEGQGGEGQGTRGEGQGVMPVFKPAVRIADAMSNVQISYVDGEPVVTVPGRVFADFRDHQFDNPIKLPLPEKIDPQYKRYRANQWKLVDWEGDGDLDLVIGIGIWDDYGWDDAWDEEGNWKNGPLHGFVYLVENIADRGDGSAGSTGERGGVSPPVPLANDQQWPEFLGPRPLFAAPVKIEAGGEPVDVYGMPSPNLADFDGDGDLDLVCGEFLDGFTYFENVSDSSVPAFAAGERLSPKMDLQMITPVAVDWDSDGAIDLICGDEDGRVAFLKNSGVHSFQTVRFFGPIYFHQEAADVKFGALVTPVSVDLDRDGDEDIVCGNTAGYVGFIENLSGKSTPTWAAPTYCRPRPSSQLSFPDPIRAQAGLKGSIQGPCEAKWGYTTIDVANWDHHGTVDLIVNDIWGRVRWRQSLEATPFQTFSLAWSDALELPMRVAWDDVPSKPAWTWWSPEPGELVTQWRTTPCVLDWNNDGLNDLVMLDHEGYLAFFEREKRGEELVLLPPKRIFKIEGPCEFDSRHRPVGDKRDGLLRLNANRAGGSGRRKLHFVDWDGDGRLDLLVNSVNVNWLRNVRTDEEGFTWFHDEGPLDDLVLAGHTTSPTTVDWDGNGIPDLLVGAEDGHLYYKANPRAAANE